MMRKLAIVLLLASLSACVAVATDPAPAPPRANGGPGNSQGHGPPPHAPAHGYRAKTAQNVEVVFDTQLGVYVVVNLPGNYWLDDRYYRRGTSGWTVSASFDGPWVVCPPETLPPGLRSGPAKNGKAKKPKGDNGN